MCWVVGLAHDAWQAYGFDRNEPHPQLDLFQQVFIDGEQPAGPVNLENCWDSHLQPTRTPTRPHADSQ